MPLSLCLIIHEEERLVLLDRAAERASKLIQIELFFRRSEEALRIELGVAEKLEKGSVELIRSGFRGYQHRRTRARTVFGRVVVSENLEFLDGINRWEHCDAAGSQFVIVHTVVQPIRTAGTRSTNRQRE